MDLLSELPEPFAQATKEALESPPEALFSPDQREKIESLVEDPQAQLGFEILRGVLTWSDEIPRDFEEADEEATFGALWKLYLLQYYRSMLWQPEALEKQANDLLIVAARPGTRRTQADCDGSAFSPRASIPTTSRC